MTNPGITDLIGYWSMDRMSGPRFDSHGALHATTIVNAPGYGAGKQDKALNLVAANEQAIAVPDHISLHMGAVSFEIGLWFKAYNITSIIRLMNKWNHMVTMEYMLDVESSKAMFWMRNAANTQHYGINANDFGTLENDTWYFVTGGYDAVNGWMYVSVNGVENATETGQVGTYSNVNSLYFGRDQSNSKHLDGLIDEAFVYKNRILTSEERIWLYNSGNGHSYLELSNLNPGVTDLAAYWRMDEKSGTRLDSHGINDLTAYNNPSYGNGKRGKAVKFISANSEALGISDNPEISMGGDVSFCIGLWFKPYDIAADWDPIISKWDYGAGSSEYVIVQFGSKVSLYIRNATDVFSFGVEAANFGVLINDTWYFVGAYYDAVTNKIGVGVNNIYDEATGSTDGVNDDTNPLYFGRETTGSIALHLDALIDEAFIYKDRILNGAERAWLYNAGYGRTYSEIASISPPPIDFVTTSTAGKLLISVFDSSLKVIAIIEDYYSLTWAERYSEAGDFELELPIEYAENTAIDFGNFLYIKSSDKLMVIEDMKPSLAADKSSLIVKGQSAESLIGQRVLLDPMNVEGRAEISIFSFIENHVTDPDDSDRRITLFRTEFSEMLTTVLYTDQFEMRSIYNAVETICKGTSLGFKVVMYNDELVFYVYEGVDRSYDQSINPYVVFSDGFDNVIASSFYESEKDKVNIVLVATTDKVPALQRVFIWETSEPTDMDRHESFLETEIERIIGGPDEIEEEDTELATPTLGVVGQDNLAAIGIVTNPILNISTYIPPLSDVEVLGIITTRGKQLLEEEKSVGIFEGDFDIQGNFKYGEDFFMGDIVQCNLEGRNIKARVIELVRSYSTEGEKSYIAMDFII